MATCAVTGTVKDGSETAISGATITAAPVRDFFSSTTQILPKEVSTTSASDGTWTLNLVRGGTFVVRVGYPPNTVTSNRILTYSITVPAQATAEFSTLATEI